jgi:hypothetical protein
MSKGQLNNNQNNLKPAPASASASQDKTTKRSAGCGYCKQIPSNSHLSQQSNHRSYFPRSTQLLSQRTTKPYNQVHNSGIPYVQRRAGQTTSTTTTYIYPQTSSSSSSSSSLSTVLRPKTQMVGRSYFIQPVTSMPMSMARVTDNQCNSFQQQYQLNFKNKKTPFLSDQLISQLENMNVSSTVGDTLMRRIERFAQVRCGRTRVPGKCTGLQHMVQFTEILDTSATDLEGTLYVGEDWNQLVNSAMMNKGGLSSLQQKLFLLAAIRIAIYGMCREKVYRGMRGEQISNGLYGRQIPDAGDLCIPKPDSNDVKPDELYIRALEMTNERCGVNGDQPRMTYRVAKELSIEKGRGREILDEEIMSQPQVQSLKTIDNGSNNFFK